MAAAAPALARSIVLVGLMGAGKSTVGPQLARRLGLPFADVDDEIERSLGLSVAGIFERFGEARFREKERNIVARLVAGPPAVIATGGGAFVDEATRRLVLERCTAVWLDADVETLAARIGADSRRPLLNPAAANDTLSRLAGERNPTYAEAQLVVRSDCAPDAVVDRIVAALAERVG